MKRFCTLLAVSTFTLSGLSLTAQTTNPGTGGTTVMDGSKEATGSVSDYTPGEALVLDTGSGVPVHYKFAKTVTYVDADGKTVEASGLRKNLRVHVHYIRDGGDLVVDKVTLTE